ncbi:general transcription factor IIH subunit 1-like [Oppia nitens]|uniref:general transcription factor IIH subunit 1-like n=1 Tax=Oppia nitens TaxID=1686743 RepID=UPI0023DCCBBA|nr:general transcription factor IIH subunit 1-like [Oppia nitens]
MTTSSEDVLRVVENVRMKKADGTLYMMAERIAWMPNGKDTFTISHKYADIKTQKISPEGKPKIQLQVVLDNGSDTFHFVNPNGVESQLRDRNDVKELLLQLLPKFKRKLSKEIEEKSRILNEDPELFGLYKDLVTSNIINAEEFWTNYAVNRRNELKDKSEDLAQKVGVSAAFLADIQPQSDGTNGIKYNITKDIIDAIFNTYPAVKRKHFESVPHKVSEQEFWQRFFQSHYFHRDRNTSNKEFFNDYSKNDIEKALMKGIIDPFVDLSSMDDRVISLNDINKEDTDKSKNDTMNSLSNSNQALIKRFNHHSIMVLETCLNKSDNSPPLSKPVAQLNGPPILNGNIPKKSKNALTTTVTPVIDDSEVMASQQERERIKRLRLEEKTHLVDLDDNRSQLSKTAVLNIKNRDRYLVGPIPNGDCDIYNNSYYDSNHNNSLNNIFHSYFQLNSLVDNWRPNCKNVLQSASAISALSELSPGGALMKTSHTTNLKDEVPLDVQKELKNLSFALNELLRHFWSCFPATSPQIEDKLCQMKQTLERFQYLKLQPFHEKLSREYHTQDLTAHLMSQIQVALNRFNTWQAKKNALNVRK